MRSIGLSVALLAALFFNSQAQAASLLRVSCDGDDIGAEVLIDGAFKGECPLDIKLPEGPLTLRVQKPVDALRERVFEQRIRLGDGTVKTVEALLGPAEFNAEGRRREAERLALEQAAANKREAARQAAQAEERRRDDEALAQQQLAAAAGDGAAMVALGDRYASGKGVAKSDEQATAWYRKAQAAGNAVAALRLGKWMKTEKAQDVADAVRMLGWPAEPERQIDIQGKDNIRAFVAADAFFAMAGGSQKIAYTRDVTFMETRRLHLAFSCASNGRLNEWEVKSAAQDFASTQHGVSALGGLFHISAKTSYGLFSSLPNMSAQTTRITRLSGQPFPLTAGKRFGYAKTTKTNDIVSNELQMCGVIGDPVKLARQPEIDGLVTPLICWWQGSGYQGIQRQYWHEPSGCFVGFGD